MHIGAKEILEMYESMTKESLDLTERLLDWNCSDLDRREIRKIVARELQWNRPWLGFETAMLIAYTAMVAADNLDYTIK